MGRFDAMGDAKIMEINPPDSVNRMEISFSEQVLRFKTLKANIQYTPLQGSILYVRFSFLSIIILSCFWIL